MCDVNVVDMVIDMDDDVDVPCNVEDLVCGASSSDDVKTLMSTNVLLMELVISNKYYTAVDNRYEISCYDGC